jgi:acyl phosphate:glycerol-3-phosphate acyltransferase
MLAVVVVGAYLLGSLSFAVLTSRVLGLPDPRSYGSGNPGATNVLRTGNKAAAALTLLGDLLKGWVAVAVAAFFARRFGLGAEVMALAALAVMAGHLFPVFFGFKGGKGVATALGVLLALHWPTAAIVILAWVATAAIFRYSSLSAIVAALVAPLSSLHFLGAGVDTGAIALIAAVVIYRHRRNIQKLLSGGESRIGQKSKS